MSRFRRLPGASVAGVLCSLAAWTGAGAADVAEQTWREECSACHIAYPARFLPPASWDEIMRTLNEHFGTDASVDAARAQTISRYLASAARSPSRSPMGAPVLRISESRWFLHEHDEISTKTWRSAQIRSAANCGACHQDAAAGRFSEKSAHIPQ